MLSGTSTWQIHMSCTYLQEFCSNRLQTEQKVSCWLILIHVSHVHYMHLPARYAGIDEVMNETSSHTSAARVTLACQLVTYTRVLRLVPRAVHSSLVTTQEQWRPDLQAGTMASLEGEPVCVKVRTLLWHSVLCQWSPTRNHKMSPWQGLFIVVEKTSLPTK